MRALPLLNPKTRENKSPHVVILGAGASKAAFPEGDRYGRIVPDMKELMEIGAIKDVLRSKSVTTQETNFENLYDDLSSNRRDVDLQNSIEKAVYDYFSKIEILDTVTIYDYLVLSLRGKDLIASFNWDPGLIQAYRRNIRLKRLPRICFLHGNVGVGACVEDECCGYLGHNCPKCGKPFQKVRLLYPIKNKNYASDIFIRNEWNALSNFLRNAYFVTIFGYSAPRTDVAARDIMSEVWRKNRTRELAEIEIIDLKTKEELLKTWDGFITGHHYFTTNSFRESYLWRYPRRSCDALAGATLQLDPWYESPFPEVSDLLELQSWVDMLMKEEVRLEENGVPFEIQHQS